MKLIPRLLLSATLIGGSVTGALAGNGIGGGVTRAQINWCDDASVMIEETRDEAIGQLSRNNDRIGALRIFYSGFIAAAETQPDSEDTLGNLLTFRSIARGIRISQLIGIPQVINGAPVLPGLAGERQIQGMLSFMDWYSLAVSQNASVVDRSQYSRPGAPFSTRALEEAMVNLAVVQLRGLTNRFVTLKTDRSTYIPLVPVEQYLQALAFLSQEIAGDLGETIFAESLGCQAKRLVKLSRQVQAFLSGRTNNSNDMSALNKFVLDTQSITKQIETRTCIR